ncbi:hypothetical protein AB205_0150320, partial [Aquarana catesbeiana]
IFIHTQHSLKYTHQIIIIFFPLKHHVFFHFSHFFFTIFTHFFSEHHTYNHPHTCEMCCSNRACYVEDYLAVVGLLASALEQTTIWGPILLNAKHSAPADLLLLYPTPDEWHVAMKRVEFPWGAQTSLAYYLLTGPYILFIHPKFIEYYVIINVYVYLSYSSSFAYDVLMPVNMKPLVVYLLTFAIFYVLPS